MNAGGHEHIPRAMRPSEPQVPPLSPQWPPSDNQLAEIARTIHWQVQAFGYDLEVRPHFVTTDRRLRVADDLEAFARMLRGVT